MFASIRLIVLLVALVATPALARDDAPPYTPHEVTAPDGVTLAVQEWGNPDGPAILFIHGYAQSSLSWSKQVEDPDLAGAFRLVTFDLRGHGMSDKPDGDAYYKEGQRWADDVGAIIEALGLDKPVLVAWSYGGRVVGDYLTHRGEGAIGGLNLVDATFAGGNPEWFGPGVANIEPMTSNDLRTMIEGTRAFLHACFSIQPSAEEFATMLAFNMMVPRHVRIALGGRPSEYEAAWKALTVPVLVTHGVDDQLLTIAMGRHGASLIEGAQTSFMEGIGHAPFWEAPERFNRELAAFVRGAK